MDMQNLMRQAQKMQQEMTKSQKEIEAKIFESKIAMVTVVMKGTKEVEKIEIDREFKIEADDYEMMEDSIMAAVNDCLKKISKETEEKMGKFGNMPGLF